jgi:glycosyltransferase involved in cell wall biosynthesis
VSGPTVSALLPVYNHGEFLAEALERIALQTRLPEEMVIIDDCSTDDSLAVAESFAARAPFPVRVERNPQNIGAVPSIRRLTDMASCDWLLFAAADDRHEPTITERSLEVLADYPQAGYSSGLSRLIAADGTDLGMYGSPVIATEPHYVTPAEAAERLPRDHGWYVMGNTMLWRREAVVAAGGMRPELGPFADNFLSMVLALRHGAVFIPEPMSSWRRLKTGFAASVDADPERTRAVESAAARLMAGEYAADFPPGYGGEWPRWQAARRETDQLRARRGEGPVASLADAYAEMRAAHRRGLPVSRIARRRLRSLASRRGPR